MGLCALGRIGNSLAALFALGLMLVKVKIRRDS